MNALIISAVLGVIMMFSSFLIKQKSTIRGLAIFGLFVLLVSNVLETYGFSFFNVDTRGLMAFDRFALFFNSIIFCIHFTLPDAIRKGYGEGRSELCRVLCVNIFYTLRDRTYIFI